MRRVLFLVTNTATHNDRRRTPTGLWLPELANAWKVFEEAGHEQLIASPLGGVAPIDPRSIRFPHSDRSTRAWLKDPARMALLQNTRQLREVFPFNLDAIFLIGGPGALYDFMDSPIVQRRTQQMWQQGSIVACVSQGYCGLLKTQLISTVFNKLDDPKCQPPRHLLNDKKLACLTWAEEMLAFMIGLMPYDARSIAKRERKVWFRKCRIPFWPYVVRDGTLISGQNPASAKKAAKKMARAFDGRFLEISYKAALPEEQHEVMEDFVTL